MKGGENSGWKFIRPPRSIISSLFPRPYLRPSRFFNLPPLTHRYPSIPTFTLISPFEVSVPSILTLLRRWLSNRAIYCNGNTHYRVRGSMKIKSPSPTRRKLRIENLIECAMIVSLPCQGYNCTLRQFRSLYVVLVTISIIVNSCSWQDFSINERDDDLQVKLCGIIFLLWDGSCTFLRVYLRSMNIDRVKWEACKSY